MENARCPRPRWSDEALQGLIQEFVTREGTEYGMSEVVLAEKVAEVKLQLEREQAIIVYDAETQSSTIIHSDNYSGLNKLKSDG